MEQDGLLEDRAAFVVATHLLLQHDTLFRKARLNLKGERLLFCLSMSSSPQLEICKRVGKFLKSIK